MRRYAWLMIAAMVPATLAAQSSAGRDTTGVMSSFTNFADIFGSRLVDAFDSIPANRYSFRPTPAQQTIGYIAQHLEEANYGLCDRLSDLKHSRTGKDSLADTVKARWPKDTLVARLRASLRFCDTVLERLGPLDSPARANPLLAFETDLAEHYSQLASYMRLIGLTPPSALPPKARTAINLPISVLSRYVGTYDLPPSAFQGSPGVRLDVTLRDGALYIKPTGQPIARLSPETARDFFLKEVDVQVTFTEGANGTVTGLVVHQNGEDRRALKITPK